MQAERIAVLVCTSLGLVLLGDAMADEGRGLSTDRPYGRILNYYVDLDLV